MVRKQAQSQPSQCCCGRIHGVRVRGNDVDYGLHACSGFKPAAGINPNSHAIFSHEHLACCVRSPFCMTEHMVDGRIHGAESTSRIASDHPFADDLHHFRNFVPAACLARADTVFHQPGYG
jgi:hypothetical protein